MIYQYIVKLFKKITGKDVNNNTVEPMAAPGVVPPPTYKNTASKETAADEPKCPVTKMSRKLTEAIKMCPASMHWSKSDKAAGKLD